jgi:hypothetical protein
MCQGVLSFCSYFQYGLMLQVHQIKASTLFQVVANNNIAIVVGSWLRSRRWVLLLP